MHKVLILKREAGVPKLFFLKCKTVTRPFIDDKNTTHNLEEICDFTGCDHGGYGMDAANKIYINSNGLIVLSSQDLLSMKDGVVRSYKSVDGGEYKYVCLGTYENNRFGGVVHIIEELAGPLSVANFDAMNQKLGKNSHELFDWDLAGFKTLMNEVKTNVFESMRAQQPPEQNIVINGDGYFCDSLSSLFQNCNAQTGHCISDWLIQKLR